MQINKLAVILKPQSSKMDEYQRLLVQFAIKPSLCNFLQFSSADVWRKIKFARTRKGLKIFETTITQNLLLDFNLYSETVGGNRIQMFEAIDEPTNGNDIELVIQTREGFILAPMQAKILYTSNEYEKMEHGNQINNLITYANNWEGIPLYLLYNYYNDETFTHSGNKCGIRFGKEQFGCSIINANYLLRTFAFKRIDRNGNLKWNIPNFLDLHPNIALPWFILGCCIYRNSSSNNVKNLLNNSTFTKTNQENIRTYSLDQLTSRNLWKPFNINNISDSKNSEKNIEPEAYSPKYRIIFFGDEEL